ncbi:MAG: hypothetical protein JSC189_000255 [Candidatus Tokpelaia sp. JSC189]|nr:MAG: hypothetical protein JSC189_000255 [Candidatus Tokpelaia sp. JSC189]
MRVMKSQTSFVRLKIFQLREKRRHVLQLENMLSEFEHMADELETQITTEEKKTGITDVEHFAYPVLAKTARQRRENLLSSVHNLQKQKNAAELSIQQIQTELERAQALKQREEQVFYKTA